MVDQRLLVVLEVEKDGNKFRMEMPYGAPLGDAYNAAHGFLSQIVEMSKEAADKRKPVEEVKADLVS